MADFTNTSSVAPSVPSGIADPKNPGYDTHGYLLGATNAGGTINIPNPTTGMISTVNATNPTSTKDWTSFTPYNAGGNGSGAGGNAIAPFSGVQYPEFTPPPLPDALQKQFELPTAENLYANDPGIQARFNFGLQGRERSAAAQGSLLNGGQIEATERYGQDYASSEYDNYVKQLLGTRQQQSNDYLNLAYGPSWQTNQSAVGQYNNLYGQYQDLIANNRNASNDYANNLYRIFQTGASTTAAGAPSPGSTGSGL